MKRLTLVLLLLAPSACGKLGVTDSALAPPPGMPRPMPRPEAGAAPVGANTAEAFDTTTAAERATAQAAPSSNAAVKLGRTVATLGDPADPGFWLETPLVQNVGPGRVVAAANGKSVAVELRPIEGAASAGSRISLPALRLLGVGLAGLHEVDVFQGG